MILMGIRGSRRTRGRPLLHEEGRRFPNIPTQSVAGDHRDTIVRYVRIRTTAGGHPSGGQWILNGEGWGR